MIRREIGDRQGEGAVLDGLGIAHLLTGDPQRAINHFKQALVISQEVGDRRDECGALGDLGSVEPLTWGMHNGPWVTSSKRWRSIERSAIVKALRRRARIWLALRSARQPSPCPTPCSRGCLPCEPNAPSCRAQQAQQFVEYLEQGREPRNTAPPKTSSTRTLTGNSRGQQSKNGTSAGLVCNAAAAPFLSTSHRGRLQQPSDRALRSRQHPSRG